METYIWKLLRIPLFDSVLKFGGGLQLSPVQNGKRASPVLVIFVSGIITSATLLITFSGSFRHDCGLLVASRAIKKAHFGHRGSISISEVLEVVNDAARQTGEWSGIDYSGPCWSAYDAIIGEIWANLLLDVSRIEYCDPIGSSTTSWLRQPALS